MDSIPSPFSHATWQRGPSRAHYKPGALCGYWYYIDTTGHVVALPREKATAVVVAAPGARLIASDHAEVADIQALQLDVLTEVLFKSLYTVANL
jgi:hypothetical protein